MIGMGWTDASPSRCGPHESSLDEHGCPSHVRRLPRAHRDLHLIGPPRCAHCRCCVGGGRPSQGVRCYANSMNPSSSARQYCNKLSETDAMLTSETVAAASNQRSQLEMNTSCSPRSPSQGLQGLDSQRS